MNARGQVAITAGIVLLITAVVGVIIVDTVSEATWNSANNTDFLNITTGEVWNGSIIPLLGGANGWTCMQAGSTPSSYDWTNTTAIDAANFTVTEYPTAGTYQLTGDQHNFTNISVTYTGIDCDSWLDNTTARIILEYYAVIMGLVALTLAGAWLWLRK